MRRTKKFVRVCTPTEDGEQCVYYPRDVEELYSLPLRGDPLPEDDSPF